MFNPVLLSVSALFFLAISALLYVVVWLGMAFLLRLAPHLPPQRIRTLLFAALLLPPIASGALTIGGAFLRHSHGPGRMHHSIYCGDIARFFSAPEGSLPVVCGVAVQLAAWLLVAWGCITVLRLFVATVQLERGLRPYLQPPSPALEAALSRLRERGYLGELPFFEAEVPMAYSCLIGIRRVRCVLSKALVASVSAQELEAIVMHEAHHFQAGDVGRTLVVGALNCLFFYLPPVRLLARRWREETELACDAVTATVTREPLALASAILHAQGVSIQARPLPTTALGFAEEMACTPEKRIECLLAYAKGAQPVSETLSHRVWQWAVTLALATAGTFFLLSPGTLCMAHCSLEAIAHILR